MPFAKFHSCSQSTRARQVHFHHQLQLGIGTYILYFCFFLGSKVLVEILLQKGVRAGELTKNQFSALHLATYKVQ